MKKQTKIKLKKKAKEIDLSKIEPLELSKLIQKGLEMAFDDLVKKTAAEDGELYFSENGKVVAVKAKKLLKKKQMRIPFYLFLIASIFLALQRIL